MESIKSLFNNMSDMSKTLIKILLGIILALVVLFILVLFVRVIRGNKKSYDAVETTLQNAAVKYYKKNKSELPSDGEEAVVELETLISQKYMKEMSKYLGEDATCTGNVTVINNNNNFAYIPNLDCQDKYKTKTLVDTILEKETIVDSGDGLYNDENGYVYRGEFVDNYVTFAGMNFRILRINDDGSLKMMLTNSIKKYRKSRWDNRFNVDKNSSIGINDYSVSRVREQLSKVYADDTVFNSNQKALMIKQDLCIGPRAKKSEDFSGTEECSQTLEGDYLGLIQANEFLVPSLDDNCTSTLSQSCLNYNYLATIMDSFWTITPFDENTYQVYRVSSGMHLAKASGSTNLLFTVNLSDKTHIKDGAGTKSNPYIIKDFSKNNKK